MGPAVPRCLAPGRRMIFRSGSPSCRTRRQTRAAQGAHREWSVHQRVAGGDGGAVQAWRLPGVMLAKVQTRSYSCPAAARAGVEESEQGQQHLLDVLALPPIDFKYRNIQLHRGKALVETVKQI